MIMVVALVRARLEKARLRITVLLEWRSNKAQGGPLPVEGMVKEERAAAERDGVGTARLMQPVVKFTLGMIRKTVSKLKCLAKPFRRQHDHLTWYNKKCAVLMSAVWSIILFAIIGGTHIGMSSRGSSTDGVDIAAQGSIAAFLGAEGFGANASVSAISFLVELRMPFSRGTAKPLGVIVVGLGMALAIWAAVYFKRGVMGEGEPQLEIPVREGPYQFVRHPVYLGMTIALLGATSALRSWAGLIGMFLLVLPGEISRAK